MSGHRASGEYTRPREHLPHQVAEVCPAAAPWLKAVLWGVALGLAASGLYSGAKRVGEG